LYYIIGIEVRDQMKEEGFDFEEGESLIDDLVPDGDGADAADNGEDSKNSDESSSFDIYKHGSKS